MGTIQVVPGGVAGVYLAAARDAKISGRVGQATRIIASSAVIRVRLQVRLAPVAPAVDAVGIWADTLTAPTQTDCILAAAIPARAAVAAVYIGIHARAATAGIPSGACGAGSAIAGTTLTSLVQAAGLVASTTVSRVGIGIVAGGIAANLIGGMAVRTGTSATAPTAHTILAGVASDIAATAVLFVGYGVIAGVSATDVATHTVGPATPATAHGNLAGTTYLTNADLA